MDGKEALTVKQIRTIPYLLAAPSIEEGCKRARVGKATVYGWLKQEFFREELNRRRKEVVELALETLKANVNKATEKLVEHLDSEKETISIRAAESIIEFVQRAIEAEELEQRIRAIEKTTRGQP
jgi:Transposase